MTDFRARAVCAALAAVLFAASAAAQSNRPIRLIPGGDSLPAPERAERGVRNDGALAPTERDIAGILDFATGALPATLWTGSTRRIVDPLLGSLFRSGMASSDALGLGLRSDAEGRLLDAQGVPQPGMRLVGALRRGELWESTAVPELRVQAAVAAESLARELGVASAAPAGSA